MRCKLCCPPFRTANISPVPDWIRPSEVIRQRNSRGCFQEPATKDCSLWRMPDEEGPPDYVWQALDTLGATRIDHGVRCIEDPALVERLRSERVPLTVCPLSNVKLRVFDCIKNHNLLELLDAGLCVTINSDDPAYFGGYINENFSAICDAFDLNKAHLCTLARNSFEAAVMDEDRRHKLTKELDELEVA